MKKIILSVGIIVVLAATLFALTGCKEKEDATSIIGSWKNTDGYTYTFKEDKTGTYSIGERYSDFTYEDKGDTVSILFYGRSKATEYEYKLKGNRLIIKNSLGVDEEYTKK